MEYLARAAASAARVVEPGGTIVLMTDAQPTVGDGLGRAKEFAGPAAALAELHARPSSDYLAAYQWLRTVAQGRVVLWSGLSDDESESLFATRLESPRQLQKLIDAASSCSDFTGRPSLACGPGGGGVNVADTALIPEAVREYEQVLAGAGLFDQSDRGKLELTGPEAPNFLQAMSTNDVLNLPLGAGCEAFFTTPTAKIVEHALIYHTRRADGQDAIWIDVPPGRAAALLQYLEALSHCRTIRDCGPDGRIRPVSSGGPDSTEGSRIRHR